MAHRNTLLATLGGLASLGLAYKLFQRGTAQELPLPPGPKSYPVIGQLLSMPTENQHLAFIDLGEELNSDIFSLSMFGTTIVVLNSLEDMVNLLEKRSGIYSDRMCPQMISDPSLMNWATLPSMLGYNDRWRKFRRFTHPWLHKGAVGAFHPAQQNQARLMLRNLLDASSNIESSLQLEPEFLRVTAATIMHSVYGRSLTSMGDPFISEIKEAFDNMCKAFLASNFMVNVFPSLKYIPEWFPGASWKTTARLWREQQEQAVDSPYEWAKLQIEQGVDDQSIVASMIAHGKRLGMGLEEIDDHVKQAAYNLVAGAMDTSANTLLVFILAMALFPEVQAKAQAEIDQVVGTNRLPTMGDSPNLPYTNRVIQELFRWCPILASGTPHACFKEDVYRGYRIPKGAIVLGNVWAVTRNSNVYKDPEVFNPDRFLDPNVPLSPTFGFGRRLCPGVHFAQDTLFITVASILATFKITKFKDEHGNEITPVLEADNSATFHQKPFKLVMQPRSSTHESLIRASV